VADLPVAIAQLITNYYETILNRAPDPGETLFWASEAARMVGFGASAKESFIVMGVYFFTSAEYLGRQRDDTAYVTDLYHSFLQREPDAAGLTFWLGQLAAGLSRNIALLNFAFSPEFSQYMTAQVGDTGRAEVYTVVDFYRGFLNRLPDNAGFSYWVGRFRTAQCQDNRAILTEVESMSSQFLNSAEYQGRNRTNSQFVDDMYNTFLRRGGDLAGVNFWIGQLATSSRDQIRQQFKLSPEFQGRVNAILAQGCLP
jgi:hypothetical protein